MFKESKIRSIVKSISWRFWATVTTMALVLIFTKKVELALSIGAFEVILKLIVYFFHERVWDRLKFGRHEIKPFVLWFTGLSGSGKRRISQAVYDQLNRNGLKIEYLHGESIRELFPHTGFSREERIENYERVGHLASKLEKYGIFVIASFESPFKEGRNFIRRLCQNYIEVYVSTPLEHCEARDKKGLYAAARKGEIRNMPGVDIPYEKPESPDVEVNLTKMTTPQAADRVMQHIKKYI